MTGGKATAFEWRFSTAKKCIVERRTGRNIGGTFSARYCLYRQIYNRGVGVGLSGKQPRSDCVWVVSQVATDHDRNRYQGDLGGSNWSVEGVVKIVEVPRMTAKIWQSRLQLRAQICCTVAPTVGLTPSNAR